MKCPNCLTEIEKENRCAETISDLVREKAYDIAISFIEYIKEHQEDFRGVCQVCHKEVHHCAKFLDNPKFVELLDYLRKQSP